ncbi:hypothetical protein BD779DRAFT_678059 [Infundibulicybe gibba]|nr:hypothetical protein BD779DRAFT_678059 [Infundibulicybe gibba]
MDSREKSAIQEPIKARPPVADTPQFPFFSPHRHQLTPGCWGSIPSSLCRCELAGSGEVLDYVGYLGAAWAREKCKRVELMALITGPRVVRATAPHTQIQSWAWLCCYFPTWMRQLEVYWHAPPLCMFIGPHIFSSPFIHFPTCQWTSGSEERLV